MHTFSIQASICSRLVLALHSRGCGVGGRGSLPVFLRKHKNTCDLPGVGVCAPGRHPDPLDPCMNV